MISLLFVFMCVYEMRAPSLLTLSVLGKSEVWWGMGYSNNIFSFWLNA